MESRGNATPPLSCWQGLISLGQPMLTYTLTNNGRQRGPTRTEMNVTLGGVQTLSPTDAYAFREHSSGHPQQESRYCWRAVKAGDRFTSGDKISTHNTTPHHMTELDGRQRGVSCAVRVCSV